MIIKSQVIVISLKYKYKCVEYYKLKYISIYVLMSSENSILLWAQALQVPREAPISQGLQLDLQDLLPQEDRASHVFPK